MFRWNHQDIVVYLVQATRGLSQEEHARIQRMLVETQFAVEKFLKSPPRSPRPYPPLTSQSWLGCMHSLTYAFGIVTQRGPFGLSSVCLQAKRLISRLRLSAQNVTRQVTAKSSRGHSWTTWRIRLKLTSPATWTVLHLWLDFSQGRPPTRTQTAERGVPPCIAGLSPF